MKRSTVALLPFFVLAGCESSKTTSFTLVDPARVEHATDASELKIEKGKSVFVDARPMGALSPPEFPSGSFFAQSSKLVIVVRVRIDEEGRAVVLGRSVTDLSVRSPFSAACDEAIAQAVAKWRFEPAQIGVLEPQADGRPLLVSSEPVDTTLEIAFTFESSGSTIAKAGRE